MKTQDLIEGNVYNWRGEKYNENVIYAGRKFFSSNKESEILYRFQSSGEPLLLFADEVELEIISI